MHRGTWAAPTGPRAAVALVAVLCVVVAASCGSTTSRSRTSTSTTSAAATPAVDHRHQTEPTTSPDRPTIVEFRGDERGELADQLVEVRQVALRYPTVADAEAAGYELTTPYAPGTGAHFGKDADTQPPGQPLDLEKPQSYLYDGTESTSRLVGIMYVQLGGDAPPDGFAGPLDRWEAVPGQCLEPGTTDPMFPTKDRVTEAECVQADGTFVDVTAWIQHVWVVPGWEAPGGVFAPYNADIVCADGTSDSDDVEGCPAPT